MIEQFSETIRLAAEKKTALRIRGEGSKDFYGQRFHGEVLDVTTYSGIVDYEPTELVITARAGTRLNEIEKTLADAGQMLAFEPPRFMNRGTLGGAIATGLSGPRRPYAGAARDFVLGVRLIDGRGDDLSFGGRVIKNVAGFDASRFMVGALGTLGVLTEVSLKTLPKPAAEMTLRLAMTEDQAIQKMNEWAGKAIPISATCYMAGALTVRLSGAESAVRAKKEMLGGEIVAEDFWNGLRDQTADFFQQANTLWRVSVPSTTPSLNLAQPQLIEWGGALRWIAGSVNATELRSKVTAAGGHATLFRSVDKSDAVFHPLSPAIAALHKRLKITMDPHGIFNPGRIYDF
ncbi:MAG: glycolate oxidase subunit GlcE [Pseudomonadota bacterium]